MKTLEVKSIKKVMSTNGRTGSVKANNAEQVEKDKAYAVAMQSGTKFEAQEAFNQLYKRYKASIFFMALKAVKMNEETAKDLTQEIFAKVFAKVNQYNFSTVFSTWLYNIATNHIIDYKRREKYEVFSIETLKSEFGSDDDVAEVSFQLEDKSENNYKLLERKERAEVVHIALEKVKSVEGKQIMNLIFLQGLAYEETAKEMNMPIGTIKAFMHRTKIEMAKYIKDYLKKENYDIAVLYGKSCRMKSAN